MHATLPLLRHSGFPAIRRRVIDTLQVNLGYRCNQTCQHCHVNAGPNRTEVMSPDTIDSVIQFLLGNPTVRTLDLTGGAPELNPNFRQLVAATSARGLRVIDRCNLTILEEPGQEGLAEFLASWRVEVVASLPCYLEDNVDRQRGKGTFDASIRGLQRLNALGYGQPGSGLGLNLVYNPQGASLPPAQAALEQDYKRHLAAHFGVVFNQLFTLANMPIQRFGSMLVSKGQFNNYMHLLRSAHRDPQTKHDEHERGNQHAEQRAMLAGQGLANVEYHELDLMTDPLPAGGMDATWCRWVACFVASPAVLLDKLAAVIRPGGVAIFHEYVQYDSLRITTAGPRMREFVRQVEQGWRDAGGEPNAAQVVVRLLQERGFSIRDAIPRVFCVRPGDLMWQWPATFIDIHLRHQLELGRIEASWAEAVRAEFAAAEGQAATLLITPMVL